MLLLLLYMLFNEIGIEFSDEKRMIYVQKSYDITSKRHNAKNTTNIDKRNS
jgi:plasmid rolling circle replication initiator protein Rep